MAHALSWVVFQWLAVRADINQRTVFGPSAEAGSSLANASSTMAVVRVSVFMFR